MIHTSPLPDVEIPDLPLAAFVLARAAELGDKPALVDGPTGRTITFAELDDQVRRFAGGLQARGDVGPGGGAATPGCWTHRRWRRQCVRRLRRGHA